MRKAVFTRSLKQQYLAFKTKTSTRKKANNIQELCNSMTVQGLVKNQPIDFSRGQIFVPWKSAAFKSKDSHKFTNELKF